MKMQTLKRHFEEQGVWVTIPEQVGELKGKTLVISDPLPYPEIDNDPQRSAFELIRLVINYQVEDDQGGVVKGDFEPPMELEVALKPGDFKNLEKGQTLRLAFWDESKKEWVVFEDQWLDTRDDTHEAAKAAIKRWGDPAVGVGR